MPLAGRVWGGRLGLWLGTAHVHQTGLKAQGFKHPQLQGLCESLGPTRAYVWGLLARPPHWHVHTHAHTHIHAAVCSACVHALAKSGSSTCCSLPFPKLGMPATACCPAFGLCMSHGTAPTQHPHSLAHEPIGSWPRSWVRQLDGVLRCCR